MKQIIYVFVILFSVTIYSYSQDTVYVYKGGSTVFKSKISFIDSITFSKNNVASFYNAGSIKYNRDVSEIDSISFYKYGSPVNLIQTPWKDNDTYNPDPLWKTDQYLRNNIASPYSYAGIYAYDNLTIGDNVNIYSSGISELVFKVKGTLTLGRNVKIWVRNGYYSSAPETQISTLSSSNLSSKGINFRNVYLFPSTFGRGGNGGNGGPGKAGGVTSLYLGYGTYYTIKGVGGSGGGGGAGGFGGGIGGAGGAAGSGSGGSGNVGGKGDNNGGDGGYGGANSSIGIGGGATGLGTHGVMSNDRIGAGGGGGGGNAGSGASGGSSDLYYGGGAGFGGDGGGGGGYGGGILYIAAEKIVYDEKNPPNFIVSGQVGGPGYVTGKQGQGGMLIVTSETPTLSDSIWNISKAILAPSEKGGHGVVVGNPQKVFVNNFDKNIDSVLVIKQDTTIKYTIGQKGQAGGIVFYDKGTYADGWRYLEASPYDLSSHIQWYGSYMATGASGTAIGTGKSNTEAIINAQGTGDYAASKCVDFSINGYNDWFLPSKDELNLMYSVLRENKLGHFNCTYYWSSSEYNSTRAWIQTFENGGQGDVSKKELVLEIGVRAARAF